MKTFLVPFFSYRSLQVHSFVLHFSSFYGYLKALRNPPSGLSIYFRSARLNEIRFEVHSTCTVHAQTERDGTSIKKICIKNRR